MHRSCYEHSLSPPAVVGVVTCDGHHGSGEGLVPEVDQQQTPPQQLQVPGGGDLGGRGKDLGGPETKSRNLGEIYNVGGVEDRGRNLGGGGQGAEI